MAFKKNISRIYYNSWQINFLIGCLLTLGTVLLCVFFVLLPEKFRLAQLEEKGRQLQQQYEQQYQQYINFRELSLHEKIINNEFFQQFTFLAHNYSVNEMMQQLVQSIKVCKLKLITIKPGALQKENKLFKQQILLNLEGDDKNFIRWLWLTAQQPVLLNINQYEIQKNADGVNINLEVTLYHE